MSATDHVSAVLSSCSGLLYALRILRTHGMPASSLHDVFRATIVAKILYGSPAWSGLCFAADRSRLNAFLRRCKRYYYCSSDFPAIEELFSDADDTLFERFVYYPAHVLHPILPEKSEQPYNLRDRRHNYCLVEKTSVLNERDYITLILYKNSY